MQGVKKILIVSLLTLVSVLPLGNTVLAQESCPSRQWEFIWINPPEGYERGTRVPVSYHELILANPSSGTLKPSVPSDMSGMAEWACVSEGGGDGNVKHLEGTELCVKAAELAGKYGGYTTLDNIQENLKSKLLDFLGSKFKQVTGIDLDIDVKQLAENVGQWVAGELGAEEQIREFKELFKSPLENEVNERVKGVMDGAKNAFFDLTGERVDDFLGTASGATELLLGSQIPVKDEKAQAEIRANREALTKIYVEQQHDQIVEQTRNECEVVYKSTVETIKRSILYQLSTQVTDWITTGKNPQFVSQPGKFLQDSALLSVDRFISRVAPQLCEPFRLSVTLQIPTTNRRANPFYEQVTCSLDQVTSNIENFYNNFRNGGWLAYQEIWKPQNNYYDTAFLVETAQQKQYQEAYDAAEKDLDRGGGFRSEYQCTFWTLFKPVDREFTGSIQESVAGILQVEKLGKRYVESGITSPSEDIPLPEDGGEPGIPNGEPEGSYWECQNYKLTTPGSVTQSLSERAAQSDLDYLQNTNDIENFMETIEDAILNKLIKSGVKGLKGLLKGLPDLDI